MFLVQKVEDRDEDAEGREGSDCEPGSGTTGLWNMAGGVRTPGRTCLSLSHLPYCPGLTGVSGLGRSQWCLHPREG